MFYYKILFVVFTVLCCAGEQFEDECGLEATYLTPLVRGGQTVGANGFPWQVAIFKRNGEEFELICGGSLVRSTLVITAAHCFSAEAINHQVNVDDFRVVGGSLFSNWTALTPGKQTSMVREVRLGERYGGHERNYQDDIALVQLKTEFKFSRAVRTVCLDLVDEELDNTQTSPGSVGKVAGWGFTDSDKVSDVLKFLRVPVVGDKQCMEQLLKPSNYMTSFITADKLCAGLNNEGCILKGFTGVCREFSACPGAMAEAARGILPQFCPASGTKVCCVESGCPPLPPSSVRQRKTGSKAADYCIELAEKIYPCQETRSGWTRGDICPLLTPDSNIQYHKTSIMKTTAEAPYYGRIGSGQRGDITWQGYPVILVSDQWVLCSAWAFDAIGSSYVKFVGLGGTFKPRYNPDEIYGAIKQHIHPLYNQSYSYAYNNIALLQLDREVKFTSRILPVCLHTGTPLPDSGFIFTGWDGLSPTDGKTSVQRLSLEECSIAYPTDWLHPTGIKHDVQICSRPVNTTEGCLNWHMGSPLTLPNSHRVACTHLLVGLKSSTTDSPCTYTNTRISAFIPWIEGIVWPESGVVV